MANTKRNPKQETELAQEILGLPPLMFTRLKFTFFDKGELTPPQISALTILAGFPDGLRMSDLAKRMSGSLPAATGIITRLHDKGFVERINDPKDRRVVAVKLTHKGKKANQDFNKQVMNIWIPIIKQLKSDEQAELLRLIKKVKSILIMEEKS